MAARGVGWVLALAGPCWPSGPAGPPADTTREQACACSTHGLIRPESGPQVKYILGLTIPRADRIQQYLEYIFDNLWQFK